MNKRQTKIMNILRSEEGYITYAEIADRLEVSVKTIRNDVASMKEYLAGHDLGTIETKPHAGIRLRAEDIPDEKLIETDEEAEIEFFVIRSLLKDGKLTTVRLTQEYYIGRGAADRLSDSVAARFSEHHILYERRRGKGTLIEYSEFNYRMARMAFYFDFMLMYEKLVSPLEDPFSFMPPTEYTAMTAALDGFEPRPCEKALYDTERQFGISYNLDAGLGLLFLISLTVQRTKEGKTVELPKPSGKPLGGTSAGVIGNVLADNIERECNLKLPESERKFIDFAVSISEIESFDNDEARRSYEALNVSLCSLTVRVVKLLSEIAGVDLRDDSLFVKHMFMQLKATIQRLRYGIVKKNRLLPQIKAKYPNMMAIAWFMQNVLEKELKLEINEHEVGFLALHIGGAIERRLSGPTACIVCDYGVGISYILKEKISRAFPEIQITSVFSGRDMYKIKREQCDMIITTIPLDGYRINREIVKVGHLLDERDIKHLEKCIRSVKGKKTGNAKKISPKTGLFNKELIFPMSRCRTKAELLTKMCAKLEALGYVTGGFEKSVIEREKTMPTDIGGMIALPHGHSKYVNHSVAAFASLKNPIEWGGNNEADLVFLAAFDLDESEEVKEKIIAFYKSFVSFTENEAECENLRKLEDSNEIYKIFEQW